MKPSIIRKSQRNKKLIAMTNWLERSLYYMPGSMELGGLQRHMIAPGYLVKFKGDWHTVIEARDENFLTDHSPKPISYQDTSYEEYVLIKRPSKFPLTFWPAVISTIGWIVTWFYKCRS